MSDVDEVTIRDLRNHGGDVMNRVERGTVIMLPRLISADALPAEPLISSITLAELSVGPSCDRAGACGRSMPRRRGSSGGLRPP